MFRYCMMNVLAPEGLTRSTQSLATRHPMQTHLCWVALSARQWCAWSVFPCANNLLYLKRYFDVCFPRASPRLLGRAGEARRRLGKATEHSRRAKKAPLAHPPQGQAIAKFGLFGSIRYVWVECLRVVAVLLPLVQRSGSHSLTAFTAKIGILLPRRPWQMAGKLGGSSRRRRFRGV